MAGPWTRVLSTAAEAAGRVGAEVMTPVENLLPWARAGREKDLRRVVVLGTGWGAARVARDLDLGRHSNMALSIVSPRNHMVMTPLLASTTTGTLDCRSVCVSLREIQPGLQLPDNHYYPATARAVDTEAKAILCEGEDGRAFEVDYDTLVIATGAQGSTFGIPGVTRYAHFLRDIKDASAIRKHLTDNISQAALPTQNTEEKKRLLNCVIVGGGPTGVEFASELSDFIRKDLFTIAPEAAAMFNVLLVEASGNVLGTFDHSLRSYAARNLMTGGVQIVKGAVNEVRKDKILLNDGSELDYGILVWATGVGPTPFISSLPFQLHNGRIDQSVSLNAHAPDGTVLEDVFAIGDCAANPDEPLPALAQVAEQQGAYVAAQINSQMSGKPLEKPFLYRHLGSMASLTTGHAVMELGDLKSTEHLSVKGLLSWFAWRSAYLTKLGSWRARLNAMANWTTSLLLGRDISRW